MINYWREEISDQCVEPYAKWTQCIMCHTPVKICERELAVDNNYCCPEHPDGVELTKGWVCSEVCYERYMKKYHNNEE